MSPMSTDQRAPRFDALFSATHRRVLGYVLRRGASPTDAEDVVADVYVVAWRRLDDIPWDDPLPWLIGVARNVLRSRQRARRRNDALLGRLRSEPGPEPAAVTVADDIAAVRRALAALSDPDRELLQLAAVEELSPAQIAVALGCTAVTARVRLHRARVRLRAALEEPVTSTNEGSARTAPSGGSHA
jgi:RNA polymerase sigma factor (sigma-70 family)